MTAGLRTSPRLTRTMTTVIRDVWIKANPNLGVSITHKYLAEQVREADGMPAKANIVKRLNFCIWTNQAERWLDIEAWAACNGRSMRMRCVGNACYCGLDLSGTQDITAFVAVFPDEADRAFSILAKFWMPEEVILDAERRDHVPYRLWIEQGWIEADAGNVIDHDSVAAYIEEFARDYEVREIGFDPWNALQLSIQLGQKGATWCNSVRATPPCLSRRNCSRN